MLSPTLKPQPPNTKVSGISYIGVYNDCNNTSNIIESFESQNSGIKCGILPHYLAYASKAYCQKKLDVIAQAADCLSLSKYSQTQMILLQTCSNSWVVTDVIFCLTFMRSSSNRAFTTENRVTIAKVSRMIVVTENLAAGEETDEHVTVYLLELTQNIAVQQLRNVHKYIYPCAGRTICCFSGL